ncbi:protein kinase [Sphaerisporangium sp. NPDC051011]|uniref:serine/threonine-protein kinase n=1 Tax=Sphaerisporangium sp. NPDC051011 TaxID=3155792 RepID=UPI0033C16141
MAPGPLQPGDPPALGAFRLVGRLGEGGQGVVYEGLGPSGGRVAVKVLKGGADPDTRRRLARELESARRVAPFCTARVLAADLDRADPYVVSEFVAGPSLQERVRDGGPLRDGDLDRLAVGTASALAAIHGAGVVHRDFKPANVLLGPDGPRVVDFGIARPLDASTAPSALSGTPPYMAPEQLKGVHGSPAADVFAWAATIVFAATGRPPFGSDTIAAVFNRILTQDPDLTGVPEGLRATLLTCLTKDPQARPSARSLLVRLVDPGAATVTVPEVGPVPTAYVPAGWSGTGPAGQGTLPYAPGAGPAGQGTLPYAPGAGPAGQGTVPYAPGADPAGHQVPGPPGPGGLHGLGPSGPNGPGATKVLPADPGAPTTLRATTVPPEPVGTYPATPYRERTRRTGRAVPLTIAAVALAGVATAGVLYANGTIGRSPSGTQATDPAASGKTKGQESTSPSSAPSSAPAATTEASAPTQASDPTGASEPASGPTSAPPPAQGGGIPATFAGTWTGQIESQDSRKNKINLTITLQDGQRIAQWTHDACRQQATLTRVTSATVLLFAVEQRGQCVGGDVTLTLKDPGTLDYVGQEGMGDVEYHGSLHHP